jgi:hypothetical protein
MQAKSLQFSDAFSQRNAFKIQLFSPLPQTVDEIGVLFFLRLTQFYQQRLLCRPIHRVICVNATRDEAGRLWKKMGLV